MKYVYAALLLNSAGKEINEDGIKKIIEAAGISPDEVRIKALAAALEGVDINNVLAQATAVPVSVAAAPAAAAATAAPAATTAAKGEETKEEKKEEEEAGIEGLSALFG
ncbi:MAG: 50S ribosomal protein P1 [Methanotrichaceae archaeon]|nr:50S ribosomal protein P1 [Methanotrichaceae archaeon]